VTPANDEQIAGHLKRLVGLLLDQIDPVEGWPASFVFPEPQDDAERTALSLFLADLQNEIGAPIRFGPRLNLQTLPLQGLPARGFMAHVQKITPHCTGFKTKNFFWKAILLEWTDGPLWAVGSATGSRLAFQWKDNPGERTRLLSVQSKR
jgi:hypothetical protein